MVQGLELAIIEEQGLRRAVTDDEKAMAYVAQIQRDIVQYWSRPPSARNGMESLLRVSLIPTGEVIDVKLEQSSGNDAFDRSAIQAVRKARRFTVPSDTLRFERDFREFTVLFKPDDLRLWRVPAFVYANVVDKKLSKENCEILFLHPITDVHWG